MNSGPRVHMPKQAQKGDVVRIRTKVLHPMETGWRKDHHGHEVPRNRIHTFVCTFEGQEVFSADLHSGVAKDPYLSFFFKAETSGTLNFVWKADNEVELTKQARIEVV